MLVQDEYSDPADFHLPYRQQSCASSVSDIDVFEPRLSDPVLAASEHLTVEESRLPIVDDDYCEPFEAQLPFLQGKYLALII